jgi:hypothetical protein
MYNDRHMQDDQSLPHSPLRLDEAKKLALLGASDGVQNQGDRQLSHRVDPVGGHETAAHVRAVSHLQCTIIRLASATRDTQAADV